MHLVEQHFEQPEVRKWNRLNVLVMIRQLWDFYQVEMLIYQHILIARMKVKMGLKILQ